MALILQKILNFHDQALEQWKDPRVDDWFLMKSIWPTFIIIGCYLYFVLNLGPKLMENRQPFKLDKILIVYNVIQVLYCTVMVILASIYIIPYYNVLCEPCDYSNSFRGILAAKLTWWYFILKIIDLLDTVFFVLRKNYHQISFLHTYHHAVVVVVVWIAVKFIPGGSVIYLGHMNNCVHIAMYSYYLLSVMDKSYRKNVWIKKQITHFQLIFFVLRKNYHQISFLHVYHHAGIIVAAWVGCRFIAGGSTIYVGYFNCLVHILMYSYYLLSVVDKSYRNNILFKKQITHLQLLQFGLIFLLNAMILINSDCTLPKPISLILLPQNFFMFLMFGDFYVKAYLLPKRKNMQVKK